MTWKGYREGREGREDFFVVNQSKNLHVLRVLHDTLSTSMQFEA